jgi:hypothetical protein
MPAAPDAPEELAPQGSLAEAEVPQHALDPEAVLPDDAADAPLEQTQAYELAAEDGAPLPAGDAQDPGAGELAPEFRPAGE